MQKISLNIVPSGICPRVYVNQYDVGREIQIKFKDGSADYGFASGTTFKVNGRKEDNHVFEYTESDKWDSTHYIINKSMPPGSATTVYLYTTEQMTAVSGEVLMQLTYKLNDAVMGTLNFIMVVQERPEASGDPSESDVPGVVRLINGIAPDGDGEVVLKWKDQSSVSNLSIIENTHTMSTTRNAGTYVYVKSDDQLYVITSTINSGGTLTPGTNATATSVGAALAMLNNHLTDYVTVDYSGTSISTADSGYYYTRVDVTGLPTGALMTGFEITGSFDPDVNILLQKSTSGNKVVLCAPAQKTVGSNRTLNVYYYVP